MRDELQSVMRFTQQLPPEQLPTLLGEIEEIRCTAMARLTASLTQQPLAPDQLLSVEEASRRLGVGRDYLYRHSAELLFTRRMGGRLLFSSAGIDRYIRQQDGVARRRQ